ncbi:cytotoxic translational repressor of toxin-antitoxin stability system [Amycolatopsis sp. NPDC051373]|uniref:cytotoxic translational repressor of toxin-antitoxin stability system n=1 Tax=Amycolatopsis sp. NPDC051373 TaxID=3155801 RepID=UPI00344F218D
MRDARERSVTHHVTYELHLSDGRVLRTRNSRRPNRSTDGPQMWRAVLRHQLCVTEAEYWACVQDDVVPERSIARPVAEAGVPAQVVHTLIHQVGIPDAEVAAMSREEAIARVNQFWTEGA